MAVTSWAMAGLDEDGCETTSTYVRQLTVEQQPLTTLSRASTAWRRCMDTLGPFFEPGTATKWYLACI